MPLSPSEAPARELLHIRSIDLRGYQRDDGLFDIEAHLEDTKSYGFDNHDRGRIEAGEALHGMWVRLTVDENLHIHSCEAVSDFTPYSMCPEAAPNFASLAGLTIGPGFNKAVHERVGGVKGCTHLRELLAQMATVAFQTIGPVKWRRAREARERALAAGDPNPPKTRTLPINSCHAYAADSPLVKLLQE